MEADATTSPVTSRADPAASAWSPYRPSPDAPWDVRRVVHLHRRAGFGATWGEVRRDLAGGPDAAVGRLLAGTARRDGVPADFAAAADRLAGTVGNDAGRLRAWWAYRLLFSPDPLAERLTLMWHGHFATAHAKVADAGMMLAQNQTFRRLGRGRFADLLAAMLRDPALLVWLDAPDNRAGGPNENLARELLELFTLGVGNYAEADVREAARALTGLSVADGAFRDRPARHDTGEKVILGRRGTWGPADVGRILCEHPATARRLAWRLCDALMGEGAADDAAVDALAVGLRAHDLDVGWAVETVLRSARFFAAANLGTKVAGPVDFVVAAVRAVEAFDPPPSTLVLAEWVGRMGQELFDPPNVGGWAGGPAWLNTRAVLARANFAAALTAGETSGPAARPDLAAVAARHGRGGGDAAGVAAFFRPLLLAGAAGATSAGGAPASRPSHPNDAVAMMLASPEAQLC